MVVTIFMSMAQMWCNFCATFAPHIYINFVSQLENEKQNEKQHEFNTIHNVIYAV